MKENKAVLNYNFIEDLEETELRLHTWFRDVEEKNDQFKKAKAFFRKKGVRMIGKKLAEEIRTYHEHLYYKGKFYAYLYVLGQFKSDVAKTLERLRGIKMIDDNTMMETKEHYSEIKGHFDTDEYAAFKLKSKKVMK